MRPSHLTNVMAPLVWKYQSRFRIAAIIENAPNAIKSIRIKYSVGSILLYFYGAGTVRVLCNGDFHNVTRQ